MTLTWKKKWFDSTYHLFQEETPVGQLEPHTWKLLVTGSFNKKTFEFRRVGFFRNYVSINNVQNNIQEGSISFHKWTGKPTLTLRSGKPYALHYTNTWHSKWALSNNEDEIIYYKGNSTKGEVNTNNDNEILILSGLYLADNHWRLTLVILFVIIIPAVLR